MTDTADRVAREVELETSPGRWEKFSASCDCKGEVRRITEGEVWSLGPGHRTQPMIKSRRYECATCGAALAALEEQP